MNWSVLRDRLLQAPWVVAAPTASAMVVLGIALLGGWAYDVLRALLGVAVALLALALLGALANGRARRAADQALQQQRQQLHQLEDRARRLRDELDAHTGSETRLQELNHQLAETERFMRLVTDNIPARLAYWDSERRCLFINRAGYANWGKRREDFIGRTSKEIFGQTFTSANEPYSAAALRGEAQTFERDERLRSGETVVTLMHYEPDIRDGRVVGFFSLATDVTRTRVAERRLREINEQLRQALERAEAGSRAKTMFLSNMSHEIRTPMNAILGLTHLLRRSSTDPLQSDRLRKVTDAADYLLRIINDILDLAKIESGRLRLETRDFSLDEMLAGVTALVSEQARDKGLELVIATDQVPDRLHGDSTRLAQALLNLLGNAVKFTERGMVRLNVVVLEHKPPHVRLRFEVHDTGIGVDPGQLDLLFTPFQQADGSTTRRFGGTGLGLAITKHIAELMDGEVGGESTPVAGSRFWFSAHLMTQASQTGAPTALRGLSVLLVDDLPEVRDALGAMLHAFGMRADLAADMAQALRLRDAAAAAGRRHDVVLIDWELPDGAALALAAQLREGGAEATPLLLTARDDAALREVARAAGAQIVLKPITASSLLDSLLRALGVVAEGPAAWPPPGTAPAPAPNWPGARVLVVEDNRVNQDVAVELLRTVGIAPDVAEDGLQAVQMARAAPYDLILMDLQMPGLDGLQATRELRSGPDALAVPIVAMTADAFVEDRNACLAAGMNDHIAKPIELSVLHAVLQRWLPAR